MREHLYMSFEYDGADQRQFQRDLGQLKHVLARLALNPRDFAANGQTGQVEFTFRNRPVRLALGPKFQVDVWTSAYAKADGPEAGDFPEIGSTPIDRGDLVGLEALLKHLLAKA